MAAAGDATRTPSMGAGWSRMTHSKLWEIFDTSIFDLSTECWMSSTMSSIDGRHSSNEATTFSNADMRASCACSNSWMWRRIWDSYSLKRKSHLALCSVKRLLSSSRMIFVSGFMMPRRCWRQVKWSWASGRGGSRALAPTNRIKLEGNYSDPDPQQQLTTRNQIKPTGSVAWFNRWSMCVVTESSGD